MNRAARSGPESRPCWTPPSRVCARKTVRPSCSGFMKAGICARSELALGASEDAAEKRVNRALEKLRKFFTKRGVSSTTAIIAGAISANSVQAAPVALAKSVTAVAMAKGAAASGSTLALVKGTLKIMTWTKLKLAAGIGAGGVTGRRGGHDDSRANPKPRYKFQR